MLQRGFYLFLLRFYFLCIKSSRHLSVLIVILKNSMKNGVLSVLLTKYLYGMEEINGYESTIDPV